MPSTFWLIIRQYGGLSKEASPHRSYDGKVGAFLISSSSILAIARKAVELISSTRRPRCVTEKSADLNGLLRADLEHGHNRSGCECTPTLGTVTGVLMSDLACQWRGHRSSSDPF